MLQHIYCRTTGVEYMHLNNLEQQDWIRQRFEAPRVTELSHDQKKVRCCLLELLCGTVGIIELFHCLLLSKGLFLCSN